MALEIPRGYRFYREMIATTATRYRLDPVLVQALVWKESDFNTDAFRHEPDFWNRYLKGNSKYAHLNPRRVSSSYGLMQVMYCRLLEDRIADNDAWAPELLFVPENGLDIGCAFLAELMTWAQSFKADANLTLQAALAAYNGGRGGNRPGIDVPLRNGQYARDVLGRRALLAKHS